jgi:hypothetical protein
MPMRSRRENVSSSSVLYLEPVCSRVGKCLWLKCIGLGLHSADNMELTVTHGTVLACYLCGKIPENEL